MNSVKRILSAINREARIDYEESDIIELIGKGLEGIGCVKQYKERVCLIPVNDHRARLPDGFHAVIQAVYRGEIGEKCNPAVNTVPPEAESPEPPCPASCDPGQYVFNPAVLDWGYTYNTFSLNVNYNEWTPVRLATHNFFKTLVCKEDNYEDLYRPDSPEYTLTEDYLTVSERTGYIMLSYLAQPLDEEGYPLIPDNYSYESALVSFVCYKFFARKFSEEPTQANERRMQHYSSDWQWYCQQAKNSLMMIQGIDEHENMSKQRKYLIPRENQYENFFGRSGRREKRRWNVPR